MQDSTSELVGYVFSAVGSGLESLFNVFSQPKPDAKKEKPRLRNKDDEQLNRQHPKSQPSKSQQTGLQYLDNPNEVIDNLSKIKNHSSDDELHRRDVPHSTMTLSFETSKMFFKVGCSDKIKFYAKRGEETVGREFDTIGEFMDFCINSVEKYFDADSRGQHSLHYYFGSDNIADHTREIQEKGAVDAIAPSAPEEPEFSDEGQHSSTEIGHPPVPSPSANKIDEEGADYSVTP